MLEPLEDRTVPTVYTVTTLTDVVNPIDGLLSLREALSAANTNQGSLEAAAGSADGDVINFAGGLASGTITLNAGLGELQILDDVTIDGTTSPTTRVTIAAAAGQRVFNLTAGAPVGFVNTVTFNNLIVTGNNVAGSDGGAITIAYGRDLLISNSTVQGGTASRGGDIFNAGVLTISGSVIQTGAASGGGGSGGGGVYNANQLTVSTSTFTNNTTTGNGGAINNVSGATLVFTTSTIQGGSANRGGGINNAGLLTLSKSTIGTAAAGDGGGLYNTDYANVSATTFSGNTTTGNGGGIAHVSGTLVVSQSTFANNGGALANRGGGVDSASGVVNLTNCTFSGNSATNGGGINASDGILRVLSNTVANNFASGTGGGIRQAGTSTVYANNSIFGNNGSGSQGTDASGNFYGDYNIVETVEPTSIYTFTSLIGNNATNINGDANLGTLANNGGGVMTIAIGANSSAYQTGDPNSIGTDARGVTRSATAKSRGAYEAYQVTNRTYVTLYLGTALYLFDDNSANSTGEVTVPVTGLLTGEKLLSIDLRPSDGKVYGFTDQYRIYTINVTTGAATFQSALATGLNDGQAAVLDQALGLFVDEKGFFQSNVNGGNSPKWLRGSDNTSGNPWYFLRLNNAGNTELLAWDGTSNAATQTTGLLATLSAAAYYNPALVYDAFTSTASLGGQAQLALDTDQGAGLYVDVAGFYQRDTAGGGSDPKWLRGSKNLAQTPWYYLKVNGSGNTELWAWNGTGTSLNPNGTVLQTFTGDTLFKNPELLYNAVTVNNGNILSMNDRNAAEKFDGLYGLYVDEQGYFQGSGANSGTDPKWLRGENNIYGNPWYILRLNGSNTEFLMWDGVSSAATQVATDLSTGLIRTFTGSAAFSNPEVLFKASTATFALASERTEAQGLDNSLGLYVDEEGFYQRNATGGGSDPKWLRGVNNSFGRPWYVLRLTTSYDTELVAWNGGGTTTNPTGTVLKTFIGTAVFLNPELLYEASSAKLGTGLFGSTDSLSIDFDPVTFQMRVVTSTGQNLTVNPATGVATTNTALTGRNIADTAYGSNLSTANSTTLYYIDYTTDTLYRSTTPNTGGALTSVGALGVNTTQVLGFEIFSMSGTDVGYAILRVGTTSNVYTINLTSGAATVVTGVPSTTLLDNLFSLVVLM